jgi:predicted ATPase/Tfp pilus assembly protein PilF
MNESEGTRSKSKFNAASDDKTLPLPGYVTEDDAPIPGQIGNYPITGVLGRGGMGTVFAAQDTRLKRRIAIKVLPERLARDDTLLRHFRREAQHLAALNHPNIATIYSLEETADFHFITMELVSGRTLAARIDEHPLSVPETLAIARQIAQGLEAAHRKGIIHRDLKPVNIMITPEGRAKVLDFGLASMPQAEETDRQPISGTPGYMSPEQARGEPVDPRADIWALGSVMVECMTGEKLISGASPADRVARTTRFEADLICLPDTSSEELRALVAHCLEPDVTRRLGDATSLRREIDEELARMRLAATGARPREGETQLHLPVQLSTFIGRSRDLHDIDALISRHRLVTLTGFGGCGKTRLSLEVAERAHERFPDGVWFIDLSAVSEPERVSHAIARALSLKEQSTRDIHAVLAEFVQSKRALLVLDNCEHLVEACAELVAELLQAGPDVVILATSREPLHAHGEALYRVDPLPTPSAESASVLELAPFDSVMLFVDRARAAGVEFELSDQNAAAVASICRRLDGIPLGLELAAAKVRAFSVKEIARRLRTDLMTLSESTSGTGTRHETLRALIDWSHDLLSPAESTVFEVASWDVVDVHTHLVDKSLILMSVDEDAGRERTRYRMLDTVREYANERLHAAGEVDVIRSHHRDHFIAFAEIAEPHLRGFEQARWFSRIGLEHENIRLAFEACTVPGADPQLGVRLAGALGRYWMIQGHWSEGRDMCDRVLRSATGLPNSVPFANTLNAAGNLAFHQGDYAQAQRCHRRALTMRRPLSDGSGQANSLNNLGEIARIRGESKRARVLYEAALKIQHAVRDPWGQAVSHNNLGEVAQADGDYARARRHHDRALALWPEIGDRWGVAWSLSNLGFVATKEGKLAEAEACYERSLATSREIRDPFGIALSLHALGEVVAQGGDIRRASRHQREALEIRRKLGDRKGIAESLETIASLAAESGDPVRATRLLGAARALRERIGAPLPEDRREALDALEGSLRTTLVEGFRGEWDHGRFMFVEDALQFALDDPMPESHP